MTSKFRKGIFTCEKNCNKSTVPTPSWRSKIELKQYDHLFPKFVT
jgi:hypothetical protein